MLAAACAVAGGGVVLDGWVRQSQASDGQAAAERLATQEHIAIMATGLQAAVVPLVARPDLTIRLDDLPGDARQPAEAALASAMAVYPAGFLHSLLDRVVLAGDIRFWSDQEIGGFYFPRGVALNCQGLDPAFIARTFHHELSSLVRLAAPPDPAQWQAANPPGFSYESDGQYRGMLRDGSSDATGPALYAEGFVRAYGKADPDDDWNTYAERVFTDGRAFAALIKDYPRMRVKTGLLVASYLKLAPGLAGYFDAIGLQPN